MFRFGFADPKADPKAEAPSDGQGEAPVDHIPAEEVLESESKPTGAQETVAILSELSLIKGVVSNAQAASILSDERVEENDLIAGVYEGGFKTWEGGLDLAQFVALQLQRRPAAAGDHQQPAAPQDEAQQQQQQQGQAEEARQEQQWAAQLGPGSRVMELGCGHGLPGLVALWAGAEVHFQDYNRSVLTTLTMQNVAANRSAWATRRQAAAAAAGPAAGPTAAAGAAAAGAAASSSGPLDAAGARYFSGSWDSLPGLLEELGLQHSYDLVLTAETIYSLEAMRSLYRAIKACLRPGSGAALVAAKSYYFGVGGGTAAFTQLVREDGRFSCEQVAVIDDGASNKREILLVAPLPAPRSSSLAAAITAAATAAATPRQQGSMALPFALFFTGQSIAIPGTSLTQADATHWVLDTTSTVAPDYHQLQEVAIFLTQPNSLPPDMGLALYVSIGGADWSYRGYVSNSHPSDVLPLSWPEPDASTQQQLAGLAALPPGFAQVGVSVEPLAELAQKEGSKLGAKEDFVKAVAYNLFAFMQSFGAVQALGGDKLLNQWFEKTMDRLRRDPDFLTRRKDAI